MKTCKLNFNCKKILTPYKRRRTKKRNKETKLSSAEATN